MSRLERRKSTKERPLPRKLSRHHDDAAIAEMRDGAARQQTMRSDPVISPRDAAAQAQYGFCDDLDVLQLDRCSDAHGALPLRSPRRAHVYREAPYLVALRGCERAREKLYVRSAAYANDGRQRVRSTRARSRAASGSRACRASGSTASHCRAGL